MRFFYPSFFLLHFIFCGLAEAQSQKDCGTQEKPSWFNVLKLNTHNTINSYRGGQIIAVPFQIHLLQSSAGTSNISLSEIYAEIDSVNNFYANAGLVFVECLAPQIINDDYYYEFDYNLHDADVLNQFYTTNVVNMYFANTVSGSDGSSLCGYSRFPPSEDYVVMAANCATNGSTLAHELGHLFGLPHTHGGSADELVDGSNCATEGDYICDTPADPTLSNSVVSINCIYTGTATDANGMQYVPDPNNIMSYSRKNCRNYFSPIQYMVINTTYNDYRNYLVCGFPTYIKDIKQSQVFSIFPNPGKNSIEIAFTSNQNQVQFLMYNLHGELILNEPCSNKYKSINTENLSNGIYFYKFITEDGLQTSGKWIKL